MDHRLSLMARGAARWLCLGLLLAAALGFHEARAQDAAALKARHAALQDRLAHNAFGRPLYLESAQTDTDLKGDIYSVVDYPYSMVGEALRPVGHWCEILILHLNVKGCRSIGGNTGAGVISVAAGKKYDQPVDEAYKLEFDYKVALATADYLRVELSAPQGPLGTNNYRISLEAVPIADGRRSFIHMSYAYGYGFAARTAMQVYLGTIGRSKVGFTSNERGADGKPVYIGGVLGLVERNTMRYYLAIDSYLGAYTLPPAEQVEKRLTSWYDATERYATQLHEMDRDEYLTMKRNEIRRQRPPEAR